MIDERRAKYLRREIGYIKRSIEKLEKGKLKDAEDEMTYLKGRLKEIKRELEGEERTGVISLPIVSHNGKQWFFDDRLKQLRNIKNPNDYIDLTNEEVTWFYRRLGRR